MRTVRSCATFSGFRTSTSGGGWLIFGLPPAELAVHPAEHARHELYLMCEDVAAFVLEMASRNISCAPVTDQRWGLLTEVTLPGGGKLGVYQPLHARPPQAGLSARAPKARRKESPEPNGRRRRSRRAERPRPSGGRAGSLA